MQVADFGGLCSSLVPSQRSTITVTAFDVLTILTVMECCGSCLVMK